MFIKGYLRLPQSTKLKSTPPHRRGKKRYGRLNASPIWYVLSTKHFPRQSRPQQILRCYDSHSLISFPVHTLRHRNDNLHTLITPFLGFLTTVLGDSRITTSTHSAKPWHLGKFHYRRFIVAGYEEGHGDIGTKKFGPHPWIKNLSCQARGSWFNVRSSCLSVSPSIFGTQSTPRGSGKEEPGETS